MNKKLMTIFLMSLIVLFQCDKNNITQPIDTNYGENIFGSIAVSETDMELMTNDNLKKGNDVNLIAWEVRLKYFAKGIAKLLNDPEIGAYLKEEIGKQFDGDYDALWETLADQEFAKKGKFKNILRKLYNTNIDMIDQFNRIPILQISAPVNFEKWDVDVPLLVAYDPITTDDLEGETITSFDGFDKKYMLDAKNEPDFPIIVVGLNERIDPKTKKLISSTNSHFGKSMAVEVNADMRIDSVRVLNDREPWHKGKPEIYYIFVNGDTELYKTYYDFFDADDDDWYDFDKRIMYWNETDDEGRSYIRWIEHDWDLFGKTWSVHGADFWISHGASDDSMGTETFHNDDPTSTTADPYETGLGHVQFTISWE